MVRACSHRGQCSHSVSPVSADAPLCWEWSTAPLGPSVRPSKHASRQRGEERRGEERRGEERRQETGEERLYYIAIASVIAINDII